MIYFRNILEARLKHTHKGHCQACGRLQAHESTGGVAKHGYTTEGGYFHGTCMGSGHKPLEHSHELCDRIQHDLHKDAEHHEKQVHDAKAGHTNPQIHSHTEYKKDEHGSRMPHPVHVPYKEAGHETKQSWHNKMLNRAHMSRSHAQMLAGLKKQIHGKPLVSAHHQAEVRKKVSGERKAKSAHKDHLRNLAHEFDKHVNALQDHFLKIPHEHRTEAQSKVYYAPQFHHWSEKHSTAARKEFPAAKETIDAIDHLVAQRKALTKKEEVQMNEFEFKQLEEGIKAKMSPQDAHDFLTQHDAHHDFHSLPSEIAQRIRDKSYEVGFKHNPKTANGSRARYFHAALVRHARRGAVKEETVGEARKNPDYRDHSGKSGYHVMGQHTSVSWHKTKGEAEEMAKKMNYRGGTHHTVQPADDISKRGMGSSGTFKEGYRSEFSANHQLSSSRSNRKPGHYLMKHGSPMHSDPHKDSAAALHAYKSLGDSKGVSIHHVKEDLEEVPGAVKTLSELKKSTLASYVKKSVERVDTDSYNTGKRFNQKPRADAQTAHRKYLNHRQGINRAVDKLAKEETVVEGAAEHEKFKDHTKNPYHATLTAHGFVHQRTTHEQNPFARNNPRADDTVHVYTHPAHGKSHVIVHQEHDPTVGHGGMKSKGHHFLHRHEQPNGIMAPSSGENKNHLHRSLSYHYGVPKGMEAPKLTAAEKKYAHIRPNYKMNEAEQHKGPKWEYQDARGVTHKGHMEKYLDHGGSDHSAIMRNEKGEVHVVSGSRLKAMKRINEDAPAMSSGGAGDPGHVQNATDNHASQMGRRKDALKAMLRRKKPMGEATWHQDKAGPIKLGPGHHVITNPPHGLKTVFTHSTREKAEEYLKNLAKHNPDDARHSHIHSVKESAVPNLAGHIPPEFDDVEIGVVSPEQLEKNRAIAKAKLPKKVGPGGVDEAVKGSHRFKIKEEHKHLYGPHMHGVLKAHSQPFSVPGQGLHMLVGPEHSETKYDEAVPAHHLEHHVVKEGVDEATGQYSHHRSFSSWKARAHKHGYPIQPNKVDDTTHAHHPVHGYHVGTWSPKDQSGWISKPHPDWAKNESVEVNELNKKTLHSYLGKADGQLLRAPSHGKGAAKWTLGGRKFANRNKGIDRAIVRLTEPGLKVSPKK